MALLAETFQDKVDRAMERLHGIGYLDLLDINPGLDPDSRFLDEAQAERMSPEDFALRLGRMGRLVRVEDCEGDTRDDRLLDARECNCRLAAMGCFVGGKETRWQMDGHDATIQMFDEVMHVRVVKMDGKWGFAALRESDGGLGPLRPRLDLGDAIEDMVRTIRNDRAMSDSPPSPRA